MGTKQSYFARRAVEWVQLLEPLTPRQAATFILGDIGVPVDSNDRTQHLANALTAWAMCAKAEDE